jgi:hypothetical protein
MTQRNNILQELNELKSSLADIAPQNIYSIPGGYFESLADRVLNRIKAMEAKNGLDELAYLSPILSHISKQMPYSVPVGYFQGLEEKLMQSVRESSDYQTAKEELETLSPLLSGLNKQMPYNIPQGYFETLHEETSAKAGTKPEAKVVSISSRKWVRYAAAAVVVGIITLAGFLYFNNTPDTAGKVLAKFSSDVKKMNETQKDSMIEFIDVGLTGKEMVQAKPDKPNEVKELLKDVSDKELKDFEEQTDDIADVLMTN